MTCRVESGAKKLGLSSTQMLLVYEVLQNKDISLNGLCEIMGLPKSTVSRLVDDLVKKNVLIREIPPENRRTVRLRVAENESSADEIDRVSDSLIDRLDSEKRERIMAALEELRSAIGK